MNIILRLLPGSTYHITTHMIFLSWLQPQVSVGKTNEPPTSMWHLYPLTYQNIYFCRYIISYQSYTTSTNDNFIQQSWNIYDIRTTIFLPTLCTLKSVSLVFYSVKAFCCNRYLHIYTATLKQCNEYFNNRYEYVMIFWK